MAGLKYGANLSFEMLDRDIVLYEVMFQTELSMASTVSEIYCLCVGIVVQTIQRYVRMIYNVIALREQLTIGQMQLMA